MSFRDAAALAVLPVVMSKLYEDSLREGRQTDFVIPELAAKFAYETADYMLKARQS